jgi:CheY-like chemotaxis protein
LVVDDNRDAADTLTKLVKAWGYDVQAAYDASAIDLVSTIEPDVILLDIAMPKVDGIRVARAIRELRNDDKILLIAVTGYHDEARRTLATEAGVDHYLIKPVDPSVIQKLLEMHALELGGPEKRKKRQTREKN